MTTSEHEGEDEFVVMGELEKDEDGGDGGLRGGGECGGHAYDGVGHRVGRQDWGKMR